MSAAIRRKRVFHYYVLVRPLLRQSSQHTWRRSRFEFRSNYKFIIYTNKSGMWSPLNPSANGRCIRMTSIFVDATGKSSTKANVTRHMSDSKSSLFINSIGEHLRCLYSYFMNKIIVALISNSKLDTATQRHAHRSLIRFFGEKN